MSAGSEAYLAAEEALAIPPVAERGRTNDNPPGIGFWALVAEDFRTHGRNFFEQGFWALFVHRFGNWRMGQPKLIRAPSTLLYRIMFKLVEWFCGISLWYTVKLGRRVRIWHHSGMVLGCRAIADDVHVRQNTTIGVAQTWRDDELPIIGAGVDIGAGACIAGAVYVGENAKIGANALVVTDVPAGATVMGNPAQVYAMAAEAETSETPEDSDVPATVAAETAPAPRIAVVPESTTEDPVDTPIDERVLGAQRDLGVVVLLGSANLDAFAMTFAETAAHYSLDVETYVPPFGQARMELLAPDGEAPMDHAVKDKQAATLIIERAEDLFAEVYADPLSLSEGDRDSYLAGAMEPLLQVIRSARTRLHGPVFVLSLTPVSRSSLGLADARDPHGLTGLIAAANARLAAEIADLADVHLLDGETIVSEIGRQAADPGGFWHIGRIPFSEAFGAHLARRTIGALLALRGQTARILVLDLDNTLWGGVLGEDGIEGIEIGGAYPGAAFHAFQTAIRALAQRGIALTVASKNDEDLALAALADHPEMALRPGDIIAHRIGWTEKALGIQEMLDEIGLGPGACMFLDDSPVEREKVRKNIPECIVPALPTAPEDLAPWLLNHPFLDCLELTGSDLKRTSQYKTRAKINATKRDFQNIEEFYRDLGMQLTFEPYGPGNQKRVLQLFAKTNQFNATLRRHDAGAVQTILAEGGEIYAVGVADRHSAYELMGVMVLRPGAAMAAAYPNDATVQAGPHDGAWWVDSFLLSCRILGRTVEDAIVAWAADRAASQGASVLMGQVIEAPRNTPVRGLFSKCGFERVETGTDLGAGGLYRLTLDAARPAVPDYFQVTATEPPPPSVQPLTPATPAPTPALSPATASSEPATLPMSSEIMLDPAVEARLSETFRRLFRIDAATDLQGATMDSIERWDSLGHLKLAMEIERHLKIRVPGETFSTVDSYPKLQSVVAEHR